MILIKGKQGYEDGEYPGYLTALKDIPGKQFPVEFMSKLSLGNFFILYISMTW